MIINPENPTLPALLRDAGYIGAVVGKWHLGLGPARGPDWNDAIVPGPVEICFDYSFLIPATGDRVSTVYVENQRVVNLDPDDPIRVSFAEPIGDESTIYNPDVTPDEIISYPRPSDRDHPVSERDVEIKMHPSFGHDQNIVNGIPRIGYMTGGHAARWRDEDIADDITERALNFIEENREGPFFLYFSIHDVHVPRVLHERLAGQSDIGVYGDVLIQMDWCVGQIMEKLDELGLTGNTLVIFTSDNGPVLDDGYHDGTVEHISGHKPAGNLRGDKYSAFEGGSRVPFIVHWPDRVEPGISDVLFSQVDMLASLAALAGYENTGQLTYDTRNHLLALLGENPAGRDYVIQQNMGGTLSLIRDNWKYIEPRDGPALNLYTRPRIELATTRNPSYTTWRKTFPKPTIWQTSIPTSWRGWPPCWNRQNDRNCEQEHLRHLPQFFPARRSCRPANRQNRLFV